jgi:hypothetical protein
VRLIISWQREDAANLDVKRPHVPGRLGFDAKIPMLYSVLR